MAPWNSRDRPMQAAPGHPEESHCTLDAQDAQDAQKMQDAHLGDVAEKVDEDTIHRARNIVPGKTISGRHSLFTWVLSGPRAATAEASPARNGAGQVPPDTGRPAVRLTDLDAQYPQWWRRAFRDSRPEAPGATQLAAAASDAAPRPSPPRAEEKIGDER